VAVFKRKNRASLSANQSVQDRFLAKVSKESREDGCWIWTASIRTDGYGQFGWKGRIIGAHKFSYMLFVGDVPDPLVVCHRCDNQLCVNPDHLFLDTQSENVWDMRRKNRNFRATGNMNGMRRRPDRVAKGEKHGQAKLTRETVKAIKRFAKLGWKPKEIADHFGVGPSTIRDVLTGKTWKGDTA